MSKFSTAKASRRAGHSPVRPSSPVRPKGALPAALRDALAEPARSTDHPDVLIGLHRIAVYLGLGSDDTVSRYRDKHGLPMVQTHAGTWITIKGAIDAWIVERSDQQRETFLAQRAAQGTSNKRVQ